MKLITWNVQWCRGVDGKVDPARRGGSRTTREYRGKVRRRAEVGALGAINAEGSGHARLDGFVDTSGGPSHTRPRPAATIITGDFNLEPDDALHARMGAPFAD